MVKLYYKALPILGVNRCIATEWRLLLEHHQGLDLPNFTTDCLAAKLQYIQCKWGFDSVAGILMLHAYKAYLVEVDIYGNVFTRPYKKA